MIIRVFRVTVRPGAEEAYERLIAEKAVPLMEKHDGLLNLQIGRPRPESPGEYVMVSTWLDQESMERFTGPGWREPVVLPGEADLVGSAAVSHYESIEAAP